MTREQRRRKKIAFAVRFFICLFLVVIVFCMMANAAAKEVPINGREYLDSIGADQSQQEHIMEVLYGR